MVGAGGIKIWWGGFFQMEGMNKYLASNMGLPFPSPGLGITHQQQPAPTQIKKKEAWAGDEKTALK